ncbi:enhancer of mRNA-decapping protein 4-like isoform X2 [Phoenix dactylifera]|uniref:Enhancer of mRNA-decapping protein 4-like isoform X2 n=1 Tax=Phoenix dactylifera TaxID=42345 RepID=A0A8B9AH69_PHODC|nr:enhancer of mRNA-decapping protein 4-like isoform X2 [Phoenix dactylifera]
MASPAGNPNPSGPFELHKLFKPPNPSPNANPSSPSPIPPPSSYGAAPPSAYPSPPTGAAPPSAYPSPPTGASTPSAYPSPPPGAFSYPPTTPPFHHHPFLHYPHEPLHRPIVSYPAAPPHFPSPNSSPNPSPNPSPGANPGARLMALLGNAAPSHLESAASMPPASSMPSEFSPPVNPPILHAVPSAPPATLAVVGQPAPARLPSSKMPRGRHLGGGDRAVYDVDSRLPGESQPPQLEVTPITKYTSDPGLVLGRQIAVNRTYICYGLKLGAIRVLNINTALRSLLRGHTQRVTDMAFFAEDVHFLASASVDGRVFVWKIDEGPDEDNKPQITGKIIIAIQIVGDGESYHPRICWHSHKQEILFVGNGNRVLKIDITKVGRGKEFSAEEPLRCPIEKLIDGVHFVGRHDGEVTDLSISQWMTTRLASASKDGTVKIWEDRKAVPLTTLRPHDGQAVNSVIFLTSPQRPDHINLITAGPLNREVKLWASAGDEGWLLPGDSEAWQCTQTLNLRSSSEPRLEEAFFNQVVVLPRASLIILANAKKNAIYAIHVDYGPYPAATCMDYIADFTVAMPILSLTGTNDCLPDGEQVVQVYCVQTQAIQQYALDLSQCLPPPSDNVALGRDPCVSRVFDTPSLEGVAVSEPSRGPMVSDLPVGSASPKCPTDSSIEDPSVTSYPVTSIASEVNSIHELSSSNVDVKPSAPPLPSSDADAANVVSSPVPLNLDLAGRLPALKSPPKGFEQVPTLGDRDVDPSNVDFSVDRKVDTVITSTPDVPSMNENLGKDDSKAGQNDISMVPNPRFMFKLGGNTTHLVTPSEILSGAISSSDSSNVNQGPKDEEVRVPDALANNKLENVEGEVKVTGESRSSQNGEFDSQKEAQVAPAESKEKSFQISEPNIEMASECSAVTETCNVDESQPVEDIAVAESLEQRPSTGEEEMQNSTKDMPEKVAESVGAAAPAAKGKKSKGKQSQASGLSSPSLSPFNSTDSLYEPGSSTGTPADAVFPQVLAMQDMLNQLMTTQKEMQKQMSVIMAVPVTKEGKRVEMALGRSIEKAVKANSDALWARFQEENAKHEKLERERTQQITSLITNCMNKDWPAMLERALKREIPAVGQVIVRASTPIIEKTISSAITDSFQRGVADKAVNQLEKSVNSKLEATVARQIQAQFQTSGKQALQDSLKSSLESSVAPAFEQSCKAMFEQVDAAFRKGMTEHTAAAQQQLEASHTPLAHTLRDAINSASTITQNLTTELIDGQRKLLALLAAGNTNALNPICMQQNNSPMPGLPEMVEAPLDPTKELTRLISERKYEEAFTMALQRSDVSIVSWLCAQVDLHAICSTVPLPLNQGVLLALLQQLACDVSNETSRKVGWMTDVAVAINPTDPMITVHVRPIFEQVYNILAHQRSLPTTTASEATNVRLIMHVINSVLMSCK